MSIEKCIHCHAPAVTNMGPDAPCPKNPDGHRWASEPIDTMPNDPGPPSGPPVATFYENPEAMNRGPKKNLCPLCGCLLLPLLKAPHSCPVPAAPPMKDPT